MPRGEAGKGTRKQGPEWGSRSPPCIGRHMLQAAQAWEAACLPRPSPLKKEQCVQCLFVSKQFDMQMMGVVPACRQPVPACLFPLPACPCLESPSELGEVALQPPSTSSHWPRLGRAKGEEMDWSHAVISIGRLLPFPSSCFSSGVVHGGMQHR